MKTIFAFCVAALVAFLISPAMAAGVQPGFEPVDSGASGNANSTYSWPSNSHPTTGIPAPPAVAPTKYPANWHPFP